MEEIKEVLNQTIQETVLAQIDPEIIKDVINKQLVRTIENVASEIFGGYHSDFKETLKGVILEECKINLQTFKIPDFNRLALDTIQNEFKKYEIENKEKILKDALETITVLTRDVEEISLKELQNTFAQEIIVEFESDLFEDDSCRCDGEQDKPITYAELQEYLYDHTDYSIETILHQREWGTFGRYCSTNLKINFLNGTDIKSHINMSIRRKISEVNNESHSDDYCFYNAEHTNIYSVSDIEFNKEKLVKEGHVVLNKLNGFEKYLTSLEINKVKINMNPCFDLEIEDE